MGSCENFDLRMVSFGLNLGGLPFFELSKLLFDLKPLIIDSSMSGVTFHITTIKTSSIIFSHLFIAPLSTPFWICYFHLVTSKVASL